MKNKKQRFFSIIIISLSIFFLFTPYIAFAADDECAGGNSVWIGICQANKGLKGWLSNFSKGAGHPNASLEPGAQEIGSAFLYVSDFLKYVVSSIAVLYIIISAVRLISAGKSIEEVISKEKEAIQMVLLGIIVIFMADVAVREIFFGETGEFLTSEDEAINFATRGTAEIMGMVHFIEIFAASLAMLMLVVSGVRLLVQGGDDTAQKEATNHIIWACVALIIIGLAEVAVQIFFVEGGQEPINTQLAQSVLIDLTTFAASVVAVLAVPALLYSGFLYIFYYGQDDQLELAKKIIKGVIIAIIVVIAAYAIVNGITHIPDLSKQSVPFLPT